MRSDRTAATEWLRARAADHWDAALAAQGFTRAANAVTYLRKVADGGRQRLHLDLSVPGPGSFQLSPRCSIAFPEVARFAIRLLGDAVGVFGKSDIVDIDLLDLLAPESPMLLFTTESELVELAPTIERYLLDPLVSFLDRRTTVAALTEAKHAEWQSLSDRSNYTAKPPIVEAAGLLALGKPAEALAALESAYPAGGKGRTEYAQAFAIASDAAGVRTSSDSNDKSEVSRQPPSLSWQLTVVTTLMLPPVPDPGPDQLERVVRRLTEERFFALLERSGGAYAQVGLGRQAGVVPGTYALEYRASPAAEHLRADTTDPMRPCISSKPSAPATNGAAITNGACSISD